MPWSGVSKGVPFTVCRKMYMLCGKQKRGVRHQAFPTPLATRNGRAALREPAPAHRPARGAVAAAREGLRQQRELGRRSGRKAASRGSSAALPHARPLLGKSQEGGCEITALGSGLRRLAVTCSPVWQQPSRLPGRALLRVSPRHGARGKQTLAVYTVCLG